jgi:exonuclease SbcC
MLPRAESAWLCGTALTGRGRQAKLAADLESLPAVQEQVDRAEAEYRELSDGRSRAQEAVGGLRSKLERLTELAGRRKEKEKALAEASKQVGIYRELSRAFGKSGIQAFLIDMAIPEIETEANRLLTKMTDNRMHVNFETQQETRSGTVKETLDIFITDELGTRDYEMFSGGEAFRINFAIRIALSRLAGPARRRPVAHADHR